MGQNQAIEVVLVYKQYVFDFSKIVNGRLPLEEFEEIDVNDYPEYLKLGQWLDGGELVVRPYLKAKHKERYHNVDIAIRVCKDSIDPVAKVSVVPQGYDYEDYDKEKDFIYFIPPRGWKINKYNKFEGTIEGHYVKIGHETIQITFKDGRTETMLLKSEISKEQKDFYMSMILDLISIDYLLCTNSNSPTYVSIIDDLYKSTKKCVDEFCSVYKEIEKNPKMGLKPYKEKKPFNKVKKISSQALIEHEIFHKEKVNVISYKDDYDIYEHRVIKTHLLRLKDLINIRRKQEQLVLEREQQQLKDSLNNVLDLEQDTIEKNISEYKKQLEDRKKELSKILEKPPQRVKLEDLEEVYIEFKVLDTEIFDEKDINLYYKPDPYIFLKPSKEKKGIASGCKYRTYENGKESEPKDYQGDALYVTQYINIKIFMKYKDAASKIYHVLYSKNRNISSEDTIGIHGFVAKNYISKNPNDDRYNCFNFNFYYISEIKKNGHVIVSKSEYEKYIPQYMDYVKQWDIKGVEESLSFYKEAHDIKEELDKIIEKRSDQDKLNQKWKALLKQLDEIEKSKFMKAIKNVTTPIRTTNLFSFHSLYQKMYSVITNNNNQIEDIDYYSNYNFNDIQIAKLPDLYEVWSFVKVVQLFIIDYGFKIQGESFRKYIHYILTNKALNETKFDLKGTVGGKDMYVSIWYNKTIDIDKEKLKRENIFAINKRGKYKGKLKEKQELRPDILLRIKYNGVYKFFVMDAKNKGRSYDEGQDICETAFQKYTLELGQGMKVNDEFKSSSNEKPHIDGSFILQPYSKEVKTIVDDKNKVKVGYSPQRYLGAYPESVAKKNEWLEKCNKEGWLVREDKLYNWLYDKNKTGNGCNENKIGIIALHPKLNNLPYLIQMIMETHFRLYKEKCWLCGHDYQKNEVETKYTEAGNPKYHIKCGKCKKGSFFVETHCVNRKGNISHGNAKLGKHFVNYYAQNDLGTKSCWNVSCPICRATLR